MCKIVIDMVDAEAEAEAEGIRGERVPRGAVL